MMRWTWLLLFGEPIKGLFFVFLFVSDYLYSFKEDLKMSGCGYSDGDLRLRKSITKRKDVDEADRKRAEKKYGDHIEYADPENKKYPIDTAEHIHAAWDYINKEEDASKYSPEGVEEIKRRIVDAWKRKINKAGPPSEAEDMKKGQRVGSYDEALAKAISGKGAEDLDRIVKGSLFGIRTENEGDQNAPDVPTRTVGSGQPKGYGPEDAGTGSSRSAAIEGTGSEAVEGDENKKGATAVERKGRADVEGFKPIRTEDEGNQNAPDAPTKKVGRGQPKGYAREE